MSQSKYSFPNPIPSHDSSKSSYKPIAPSLSTTTTTTTTMTASSSSSSTDTSLSSLTPPPIPSPTKDPFSSSRSLAPLEPQHPAIPSYLNTQRRGSITDPSLHLSVPNPELTRQYSQPDVNFTSNSISSERRSSLANIDQYPSSPSSGLSRPSSVKSDNQLFSSLESRKLRDQTLPSISASPSPIRDGFPGPLMNPAFQAQLQTRRHSIAVGEVVAPLKRKSTISGLSLPSPNFNNSSSVSSSSSINSFSGNSAGSSSNGSGSAINHHHHQQLTADDYPVKRRESIGDPAIQRLSLYDRRSSYSAPSSPPTLPSLSNNTSNVNNSSNNNSSSSNSNSNILPKLNVQDVSANLHHSDSSSSSHHHHNHHNSHHHPHNNNSSHHSHHSHHYDDLSSNNVTSSNNLQSPSSHLSEHNDSPSSSYPQPPPSIPSSSSSSSPHHFRLSQIVHDENAPILARRASMPIMPFGSRFSDHVQDGNSGGDGGTSSGSGSGNNSVPMDIDRFGGPVYSPQHHHHHHTYHPYAYDYPGYIQPQQLVKETPYSRSPELRISHKLAERKRRKEMKELFDELRDSLPVDKSLKTSKWEILSKAVDYINNLKRNQDETHKEIELLRQQLSALKSCSNDNNINNNNNNNSDNNNNNNNNSNNNKPSIS